MTGIERQIVRKLLEDILADGQSTVSMWGRAEYLIEYSRDIDAILKALRFDRAAAIEVYRGNPIDFVGNIWIEFGYGTDVIRNYEAFNTGDLVAGAQKLAKQLAEKLTTSVVAEDTQVLDHLRQAQQWITVATEDLLLPRSKYTRKANAELLDLAQKALEQAINGITGRLETPDNQQATRQTQESAP